MIPCARTRAEVDVIVLIIITLLVVVLNIIFEKVAGYILTRNGTVP